MVKRGGAQWVLRRGTSLSLRVPSPITTAVPSSAILTGTVTALSPIESEFATVEELEAYDQWFRAKVLASLAGGARSGVSVLLRFD
ncbi:type II toxin-antitoxin system RelB family antitoxin [Paraburkholderia humisilvae]|uniref:Uncharacterized protein n=1 Tax=Paraburkholderia humisilvae TaxID=627669 RepID=A0A6J5F9Y9_9BURK|nr:hypothetical protein LMG29542_07839 [Paraburkholderia humisilvae]